MRTPFCKRLEARIVTSLYVGYAATLQQRVERGVVAEQPDVTLGLPLLVIVAPQDRRNREARPDGLEAVAVGQRETHALARLAGEGAGVGCEIHGRELDARQTHRRQRLRQRLGVEMRLGIVEEKAVGPAGKRFGPPRLVEQVHSGHGSGWFISDLLLRLGLIGTVIGFVMMLGSVYSLEGEGAYALKELLGEMGGGMQVALYTTLTGLGSAILLSIQCHWLDRCADRLVSRIIELSATRQSKSGKNG